MERWDWARTDKLTSCGENELGIFTLNVYIWMF